MNRIQAPPPIEVSGLRVHVVRRGEWHEAVHGVSFSVSAGEALGLVGESGCGKTLTAKAILGLDRELAEISVNGSVRLDGLEVRDLDRAGIQAVRGAKIAMVFQDPGASLNPVIRIGEQLIETIRSHLDVSRAVARDRALRQIEDVGLSQPGQILQAYPHQLSGGMNQRVAIAMALSCDPAVLIADEPTSALDADLRASILKQLDELRQRRGLAMLLISHDLGVVSRIVDRVAIMKDGRIIEMNETGEVFANPAHPYTRELLAARTGGKVESFDEGR